MAPVNQAAFEISPKHQLLLILFYSHYFIGVFAASELLSDDIPFAVHWVSDDNSKTAFTDRNALTNLERITVTTNNKERYQCILPDISPDIDDGSDQYHGYSAGELITALFKMTQCAYRIETFWSYELCYGHFLRQFHEDKHQGTLATQEYFLGLLPDTYHTPVPDPPLSYRNIDGQIVPYYAVEMTGGTPCTLKNGEPRRTTVLYICKSNGHNELMSVKEVSTCEYEAVVHSDMLCQNRHYLIEEETKEIICLPLDDSPPEPSALLQLKRESQAASVSRPSHDSKIFGGSTRPKVSAGGQTMKIVETRRIVQKDDLTNRQVDKPNSRIDRQRKPVQSMVTKKDFNTDQILADFLSGDHCLMGGGKSWWKFEVCYGRYVQQFHTGKNGVRTNIVLGRWNLKAHVQWISKQPSTSPGMPKTRVSHYYSDGDLCDLTQKPRLVIVKFKCKQNSGGSISLVLTENGTCEYNLTVESAILCGPIEVSDDVGMLINK